jgi:hypothetical protein
MYNDEDVESQVSYNIVILLRVLLRFLGLQTKFFKNAIDSYMAM